MHTRAVRVFALVAVLSLLAASCGDDDAATITQAPDEPATTTVAAADDTPTGVSIAVVFAGVKEEPWYATMLEALERIKAESPPRPQREL